MSWGITLKSPVASYLIKILKSFLNSIHRTVKFFRFICRFKIFDYVALEIRIQKFNILFENFFSNHLSIKKNHDSSPMILSLVSLKTPGLAIWINWSKTFNTFAGLRKILSERNKNYFLNQS